MYKMKNIAAAFSHRLLKICTFPNLPVSQLEGGLFPLPLIVTGTNIWLLIV